MGYIDVCYCDIFSVVKVYLAQEEAIIQDCSIGQTSYNCSIIQLGMAQLNVMFIIYYSFYTTFYISFSLLIIVSMF